MNNTGHKYALTFSAQALNIFNDIDYGTPTGTLTPTLNTATRSLRTRPPIRSVKQPGGRNLFRFRRRGREAHLLPGGIFVLIQRDQANRTDRAGSPINYRGYNEARGCRVPHPLSPPSAGQKTLDCVVVASTSSYFVQLSPVSLKVRVPGAPSIAYFAMGGIAHTRRAIFVVRATI